VRGASRRLAAALLGAVLIGGLTGPAGAGHSGQPDVPTVTADYVRRLLDAREPVILIDFRKPAEFRAGHLPGARSLPITELDRRFREIPHSERVVLYCECPLEEIATAHLFLSGQGYRGHAVLADGFQGWMRRQYPVAR
jgi:rhodanese-related sulfurtransferase